VFFTSSCFRTSLAVRGPSQILATHPFLVLRGTAGSYLGVGNGDWLFP